MEISKAVLQEQLDGFIANRDSAIQQLNALNGAIQATELLIKKSSEPEPEPDKK